MNRRMLIMLVACALVFGAVFGFKWYGNRMMNQAFDNLPVPPATVSTTKAFSDTWPLSLEAVGTLRAMRGTDVTTEASGIVEAIEFESGDSVEQGDVLVTLDRVTDFAELEALEAQAVLSEQELSRAKNLIASNAISKAEVDQRAAQAAAARANVAAQRARIAQKVIRAPFAGQLGIRRIDLGQHIEPGTAVVTLQALDPIYVNFKLPQQLLADVSVDLPVQIELEAFEHRKFSGRLTAIEPRIDESTRNFEAQATLGNEDHVLRPGMFAQVDVDLGAAENVIVVPQTSISYNPYGDSVWVVIPATGEATGAKQGLTVERRLVTLGRRRGDLVQVVSGLAVGEEVATSGLLKLRNGIGVIVNNEIQPAAEREPQPPNS
jgi:membrane fusion protein (multidrug efflux system)